MDLLALTFAALCVVGAMWYYSSKSVPIKADRVKQGAYGKVRVLKTSSKFSILLRPHELFAAIRFKLQMRAFKKQQSLAAATADKDMQWCTFMLNKVSRSFAGVIAQLPPELRTSVCIFYLVLRALDTVEDEMDLSRFVPYATEADGLASSHKDGQAHLRQTKVRLVTDFAKRLSIKGDSACLQGIGEAHERELLESYDRVVRIFSQLPQKYQVVIQSITTRMGNGMAKYVGRDLRNGTAHTKDYNRYCEIVAGFVGEGLSELWVASGFEDASLVKDQEAIYAMGLFLQKTNIIRDYLEDLTEGRTFWPEEIWKNHSKSLASLRQEDHEGICVHHMVADAMLLLPACTRYLRQLKNPAIFKFCAIPQLMAIATLDHVQQNSPLVYQGVLKIRKGQAAWLITSVAHDMGRVDNFFGRKTKQMMARMKKNPLACKLDTLLRESQFFCSNETGTVLSRVFTSESPNTWLSLASIVTAGVLGFIIRPLMEGKAAEVDLDPVPLGLMFVSIAYLVYTLAWPHQQEVAIVGAANFLPKKQVVVYEVQEGSKDMAMVPMAATKRTGALDIEAESEMGKAHFIGACDRYRDQIADGFARDHELNGEAVEWVREMIDYNVKGGKMNRGLTVVHATRSLKGARLNAPELEDATILGWCIEWLQAFFLVADDVMDRSVTRRGKPCWYKKPNVKEIAINDAFILESCVFQLLRERFRDRACYVDLLELFHEVTLQTEIGQLLDLTSQPIDSKPDLLRFTALRHRMIVRYKTAFYSFYLPVACSMLLAGVKSKNAFKKAKQICCIMGEYFQVQDDYLDCYGDPAVIGKVGTDIQDNKCSWLVVQALAHADSSQQQTLVECYGKDDEKDIQKVKALYKSLELEQKYLAYEKQSYDTITSLIGTVSDMPQSVFMMLLAKIYKRQK